MQAAAYLRVSTEEQAGENRYGLQVQKEEIRLFAQEQGLEIVKWYEDKGYSGADRKRPELKKLLADASQGVGFQKVLVARMDRVARDSYFAMFIEKELLRHDIELLSATEPMLNGDDPQKRLMKEIVRAFASYERELIAERLSAGKKAKAKQGGYVGGRVPYGYYVEQGEVKIDYPKAAVVRKVFRMRQRQRKTLQQIADELNREGHRTTQGVEFKPKQVARILEAKDFYKGYITYAGQKTRGQHQAIL